MRGHVGAFNFGKCIDRLFVSQTFLLLWRRGRVKWRDMIPIGVGKGVDVFSVELSGIYFDDQHFVNLSHLIIHTSFHTITQRAHAMLRITPFFLCSQASLCRNSFTQPPFLLYHTYTVDNTMLRNDTHTHRETLQSHKDMSDFITNTYTHTHTC